MYPKDGEKWDKSMPRYASSGPTGCFSRDFV